MFDTELWLTSSDSHDLADVRRCTPLRRVRVGTRDDGLLVRLDPPVVGQRFGLGARDLDEVVLATRHAGASLFPPDTWPVHVHVARPLVPLHGRDALALDELETIAWAELHPTRDAASAGRA